MRVVWTVGIWLAAVAGLVLVVIGVTYLGVSAGSLPQALGRVPGSSAHFTERGLFGVMIGGLLALIAISLHQFRPGGALAAAQADGTDEAAGGGTSVDRPGADPE